MGLPCDHIRYDDAQAGRHIIGRVDFNPVSFAAAAGSWPRGHYRCIRLAPRT